MRVLILVGLLSAAPILDSGCMTITGQLAYWTESNHLADSEWTIYCGTVYDVGFLVGGITHATELSVQEAFVVPLFLVDLPLSLAADTALLPLTIAQHVELAGRKRRQRERNRTQETESDWSEERYPERLRLRRERR